MPEPAVLLAVCLVALLGGLAFWARGRVAALTHALEAERMRLADLSARLVQAESRDMDSRVKIESHHADNQTRLSALAAREAELRVNQEVQEDLRRRLFDAGSALAETQAARVALEAQRATLRETLDQERRQASEKIALLQAARDSMTHEFKVVANDLMTQHGTQFKAQNKEQIDAILHPLREKLTEFQQNLQAAHVETGKERATLGEQIRQLSQDSGRMMTETTNLTRALKGKAQTQGAWGEMVLASILEKSGLRKGEEYHPQESVTTAEGARHRPDVVVRLPGQKSLVIDSKVSLLAFETHVNAETDEERISHLARHVASVRAHIGTLGSKTYQMSVASDLDFVVMFVPIEGAFAAALQHDPHIISFALQNNVVIATPTTLMMAMRTISSVWNVERRTQNAEAIAERAGKLYDKFVGFVADLQGIDRGLGQTRKAYDDAMGKLTNGAGNIVRQMEQLKSLGAKTSKALPLKLLGDEPEVSAPDLQAPRRAVATAIDLLSSDAAE